MLFNSYLFLFLFLPLALLGWFALNKVKAYQVAMLFLIGMSLWFYGYFNLTYLLLMIGSCFMNYFCSFCMKMSKRIHVTKLIGIISISFNLLLLFYFKYYDFFLENINVIFKQDFALTHILLPLGISFFTFQQLSFIIDRLKGTAPHYSITEYFAFVTFFPQLVAGPIVLHSELIPQFRDYNKRSLQTKNLASGMALLILGLSKKVLLADQLALVVNEAYLDRYYLSTFPTILMLVLFAFELYFDFSGYSDIAIGIAKMFNIDLPINFNSPYQSSSATEFWKRWHITLSRFFTTYVYIPLGGNRKGKPRQMLYIIIVFLI